MYEFKQNERILQGDILEDVLYHFVEITEDNLLIKNIQLPYAIVLTQDCDLEQDFNNREVLKTEPAQASHDKCLQSILICPAFLAGEVREGTHLRVLQQNMNKWTSDQYKNIKQNHFERFHYLNEEVQFNLPELIADFKMVYTIPYTTMYKIHKEKYKISLKELYRERVSQRYANFLSRIGLPDQVS